MRSLVFLALFWAITSGGELFGDDSTPDTRPMIWGVCGHPTWSDYADWVPANVAKQIDDVRQLGATYYRCSFEGAAYPAVLHTLAPTAQAAGITLLPDLPIKIVAKDDAKTNYVRNYGIGFKWASYAIANHYQLPDWELGNEIENWNLVKVVYDGTSPDDFPDKVPGGFVAIASSLNGAYHGIKDAYAAARAQGKTSLVPQVLYGCCYHHWGLLTKILHYNGSLPCDIISWHWYEPMCGSFDSPLHDGKSFSNNRSPAECLGDFKNPANPLEPMGVWITELNRSVKTPQGFLNGSVSNNAQGQDWSAEAKGIQLTIDDVKKASNVKAIFIYELLDEPVADHGDPRRLRDEGSFGVMTGLSGTRKDAFYVYQNEIKETH